VRCALTRRRRCARAGQYHVIYSIHEREVLVRVVRISRRADVYG
jgi:mRNA-degrading endonuclease RelE of RelBE toxin-antitoxin system